VDVPTDWGKYRIAIERWERVLGRPMPNPTDDGGRLNPAMVEHMMGYDEGWVTDVVKTRTARLRLLGNAIVPLQAATAWAHLLGIPLPSPEVAGGGVR
jgi:DNA (cytosine-5)-methyltransferase 1